MDPILVDLVQLRALQLPAINLTPGRALAARVVELESSGRGVLAIAGARIAATLPPGVHAGDELRLTVKEVTPERLLLTLQGEAPPPAPRSEEPITDRDGGGGGPRGTPSNALTLRYETTSLGPIDLHFDLYRGGALRLTVRMATDAAQAQARTAAGELQAALTAALANDVGITIAGPQPLDLYA